MSNGFDKVEDVVVVVVVVIEEFLVGVLVVEWIIVVETSPPIGIGRNSCGCSKSLPTYWE